MCRNETHFFQDGCFAQGIKRICLAGQSKVFRCFCCTFILSTSCLAQDRSEHNSRPKNPLLSTSDPKSSVSHFPSPLPHSLPWLRLPSLVLGFDFQSLFSQFISNWHFIEFNLLGGTMGTFHHTEWYEKPQTLWMGSERQNKINEYLRVTQNTDDRNHSGGQLCISTWTRTPLSVTLFSPVVVFVSQGTCRLLTQMC